MTITVENTSPNTIGPLHSTVVNQSGVGDFDIPILGCDAVDIVIPAGASCQMVVRYRNATGAGNATARLQVQSGTTTVSIPLTGTGVAGGLELGLDGHLTTDPPIADLTDTVTGITPVQRFVAVNVSGTPTGPITLAIQDQSGPGTFSIVPGSDCAGATLPDGGFGCSVLVAYTNKTGSGDALAWLVVSSPTSLAIGLLIGHGR